MKPILDIPLISPQTASTRAVNNSTGDALFKNNIALVTPQYNADVKTGRALALSATNDLPIPTHVDGYITYPNLDTDTITQEATDGTDKVFNNITINNILTHKMAFSAGDINLLQQEPNTLAAFAMGEATPISSVTLDADDSWYACSEVSGADVFDARVAGNDTTITGDLTNVRIINQQKGLQTTALLLDANGVPESYNSTANTARVYDDTIISTGFKPSIARYSIEEESSGLMQDFGSELYAGGSVDTNQNTGTVITDGYNLVGTSATRLYINGAVPDSADKILLTFTATIKTGSLTIIGYKDNTGLTVNYSPSIPVVNGSNTFELVMVNSPIYDISLVLSAQTFNIDFTDISYKKLTTKTQRTEKRLLTHTANLIGPEIFAGAALDTNADFAEFTINTSASYSFDEPSGEVSHNAPGFETYLTAPITGLVVGATYEVSSDATIVAGNPHYTFSGVDITGEDLGVTARFVAEAPVGNFGVHCISGDGIFTFRTLSIKRVTVDDKYYIGTDGGAMVEQDVVPPLPDPNTTINLGNVAVIGYADTIESREADFNVHSEVITP